MLNYFTLISGSIFLYALYMRNNYPTKRITYNVSRETYVKTFKINKNSQMYENYFMEFSLEELNIIRKVIRDYIRKNGDLVENYVSVRFNNKTFNYIIKSNVIEEVLIFNVKVE